MRRNVLTAYFLWVLCCFLLCGLHRLYCGKTLSGLIWLFTFGLLGLGQAIDILLIPSMVAETNGDNGRINIHIHNRISNVNRNSNRVILNSRNPFDNLDELD